jgi:hypothetical protein
VFVGTTSTGIPNRVTADGCTINEPIQDQQPWDSHGAFVSHVEKVVGTLRKQGLIDQRAGSSIAQANAHSDMGKPQHTRSGQATTEGVPRAPSGCCENARGMVTPPGPSGARGRQPNHHGNGVEPLRLQPIRRAPTRN